jgi:hypothetical protein
MSQPDPDFIKFFGGEFQRVLAATEIPGMADASWDRKAAWLLWSERRRDAKPSPPAIRPVKPHEFSSDPYTSKCMFCGMGRGRHAAAIEAWHALNKPKPEPASVFD